MIGVVKKKKKKIFKKVEPMATMVFYIWQWPCCESESSIKLWINGERKFRPCQKYGVHGRNERFVTAEDFGIGKTIILYEIKKFSILYRKSPETDSQEATSYLENTAMKDICNLLVIQENFINKGFFVECVQKRTEGDRWWNILV